MDVRKIGLQPLDESMTGCTLVFVPKGRMYQPFSALAVLAGLYAKKFTGICECYIQSEFQNNKYRMGIGLEFDNDPPDDLWWGTFVDCIEAACEEEEEIELLRDECELASVEELRSMMLHAGTTGFKSGSAIWVSDPDGPDPDSPFTALCRSVQ